jgi:hypothetical protein
MSERDLRIGLFFFGGVNLLIGLSQFFTPGWFFDNIGPYGLRNDHYIGDVGSFYIAAGGALLFSISRPSWRGPLLYLGAAWYALHAVNHVFDVGDDNKGDAHGIAQTVLLAIGAAALYYLARVADRGEPSSGTSETPRGLPPRPADYPPGD